MALPKQKFREIVFLILYSKDLAQPSEAGTAALLMKELSVAGSAVREAQLRAAKIEAKIPEIDAIIRNTSASYNFERIRSVERNVLRLGIYELLYDDDIPPKVAIAEAIRLSRKFSTPESAIFVNALIDAVYKSSLGEQIDKETLSESAMQLEKSEGAIADILQKQNIQEERSESDR